MQIVCRNNIACRTCFWLEKRKFDFSNLKALIQHLPQWNSRICCHATLAYLEGFKAEMSPPSCSSPFSVCVMWGLSFHTCMINFEPGFGFWTHCDVTSHTCRPCLFESDFSQSTEETGHFEQWMWKIAPWCTYLSHHSEAKKINLRKNYTFLNHIYHLLIPFSYYGNNLHFIDMQGEKDLFLIFKWLCIVTANFVAFVPWELQTSRWERFSGTSLPIDAGAVPPGFPQATRGVYVVSIAAVGHERVDAVESVSPVQMPPAARWMGLIVVVVLVPMLIFHARGGVAEGLLHAATVLLDSVERRRDMLPSQVVLI